MGINFAICHFRVRLVSDSRRTVRAASAVQNTKVPALAILTKTSFLCLGKALSIIATTVLDTTIPVAKTKPSKSSDLGVTELILSIGTIYFLHTM
jgi:hypothetical protein